MEILKKLSTETLKKMLQEIECQLTLAFVRAELLSRKEL